MNETYNATMNVEEAAKYLNISKSLCYRMIKENKIPHFKLASRIVISRNKLEQFINQ